MVRQVIGAAVLLLLGAAALPAQQGIQRGTLQKVDPEKGTVTIAVGDKEHEYAITDDTRLPDAPDKTVAERLKHFKGGEAVFFRPERRDGKEVLWGMKLVEGGRPPCRTPTPRP